MEFNNIFLQFRGMGRLYAYTPDLYPTKLRGIVQALPQVSGRLVGILAHSVTAFFGQAFFLDLLLRFL